MLREQWIRAKYERKEFTEPGKQLPYSDGKINISRLLPLLEAFEHHKEKAHSVRVATSAPENTAVTYRALFWVG